MAPDTRRTATDRDAAELLAEFPNPAGQLNIHRAIKPLRELRTRTTGSARTEIDAVLDSLTR